MSLVKVNAIIHPSGSANNITLDSSGNITFANTVAVPSGNVYPVVRATSQATTSGTAIDFTSIPSWVKRIQVLFSGVSTGGSTAQLVQLGTASGIESTGYTSSAFIGANPITSLYNGANYTTGFGIFFDSATYTYSGVMTIANISGNTWVSNYSLGGSGLTGIFWLGGGTKTLSDTLTRVRLTTLNGTDAFDAGSVNQGDGAGGQAGATTGFGALKTALAAAGSVATTDIAVTAYTGMTGVQLSA
jgi:hypothetical protein